MLVQTFMVNALMTNCYVVGCPITKEAVIIDPGFESQQEAKWMFDFIGRNALNVKAIVNTHGHPDHTCGNSLVKEEFNVPILIHKCDAYMLGETGKRTAHSLGFSGISPPADMQLEDGGIVGFGRVTLRILHTPGHSLGSISLVGAKDVFTGDTLFAGSVGRTDFPESSEPDMQLSLRKLATLADSLVVHPGHGPTTTIGEEKSSNPFM